MGSDSQDLFLNTCKHLKQVTVVNNFCNHFVIVHLRIRTVLNAYNNTYSWNKTPCGTAISSGIWVIMKKKKAPLFASNQDLHLKCSDDRCEKIHGNIALLAYWDQS